MRILKTVLPHESNLYSNQQATHLYALLYFSLLFHLFHIFDRPKINYQISQ